MNALVAIFSVLALAATVSASGLWHGGAVALQGPSSKTSLVGPDGSHIAAVAPGGSVHHEVASGVVAHAAPILAHAAPVLAHAAPVLAHAAPVLAHAAPLAVAAPWGHGGAVLAGPAGVVSAHGLGLAHGGAWAGHGSGWEGQWAPDHSEALYDDGSYKPYVYGH